MSTETPLTAILKAEILSDGPMPVSDFMTRALGDPQHGYYTTRTVFGTQGDFITAPEVSQMFGEIVGSWAVHVAEAVGAAWPDAPVHLVELGPGRGTLMADILRVAALRPFIDARIMVHLVETSPRLREEQRTILAQARPERPSANWHDSLETVPKGPIVVIANEFFDALPIRQYVRTDGIWCERIVTVQDGELTFAAGDPIADVPAAAIPGSENLIMETCPAAHDIADRIAARMVNSPGAALIIDYGHDRSAPGDTLQAVRNHQHTDPLHHVGEADITAHVCFGDLAEAAIAGGAQAFGPITQAQFLSDLGIASRADRLVASQPQRRADIETALARLVSPDAMGALFKVMALTSPGTGAPPPFATMQRSG